MSPRHYEKVRAKESNTRAKTKNSRVGARHHVVPPSIRARHAGCACKQPARHHAEDAPFAVVVATPCYRRKTCAKTLYACCLRHAASPPAHASLPCTMPLCRHAVAIAANIRHQDVATYAPLLLYMQRRCTALRPLLLPRAPRGAADASRRRRGVLRRRRCVRLPPFTSATPLFEYVTPRHEHTRAPRYATMLIRHIERMSPAIMREMRDEWRYMAKRASMKFAIRRAAAPYARCGTPSPRRHAPLLIRARARAPRRAPLRQPRGGYWRRAHVKARRLRGRYAGAIWRELLARCERYSEREC